jgi:peroxiredoxin
VSELPPIEELPRPLDDGAADHLPGARLPALALPSTDGRPRVLEELVARMVLFVYPSMGVDGDLLEEWTAIPGARGCTPEACEFRDRLDGFRSEGIEVLGLSGQPPDQQREAVERLGLTYPLLSDERLELAASLGLPMFEFRGRRYFKRITLILSAGSVEAALYPVFPPNGAAEQALGWLAANREDDVIGT